MTESLPPDLSPPRRYAVLELFGQKRLAGAVREVLHGGTPFLRIDVPTVSYDADDGAAVVIPGHTHDVRPANIYCIDWVEGAVATEVAHLVRHRPAWMCDTPAPARPKPASGTEQG